MSLLVETLELVRRAKAMCPKPPPYQLYVHYKEANRFEPLREMLTSMDIKLCIVSAEEILAIGCLCGETDEAKIFKQDNVYLVPSLPNKIELAWIARE